MEEWPPVWRVATDILNKELRTANKGWSSRLEVGRVLTPHHKKLQYYEIFHKALDLDLSSVQTKQRKRDMRSGSRTMRSLYKSRSLTTVARNLRCII